MDVKLEDTIYLDFTTHDPITGEVTDADAGPTCEVFENDTDVAILTPACTKRNLKTGNYRLPVACTSANGFEVGKSYGVVVTAVVSGVTAKCPIATLLCYPKRKIGTVVADTGNTASTFKTDLTEATNDWWKDVFVMFIDNAALDGQVKKVTAFDQATDFITTDAFTTVPTAGNKFIIINQ